MDQFSEKLRRGMKRNTVKKIPHFLRQEAMWKMNFFGLGVSVKTGRGAVLEGSVLSQIRG